MNTWEDELLDKWNLGMVTDDYIFYCNLYESDENASVKMYDRNMHLISDNYFAWIGFEEEMKNVFEGKTKVYYVSVEIAAEMSIRNKE